MRKSKYKPCLDLIHALIKDILQNKSRICALLLLSVLALTWVFTRSLRINDADRSNPDIIRFHVIANSDSKDDQQLKYEVKDALVKLLKPCLGHARDVDEARAIIGEMLPAIRETAERVISENGYDYPVTASLASSYFPMKVYGDYTFPPGNYEALQVRIGDAEGKNWWCVMFPPLCFIDETYCIIDEDGEEKLEFLLTEEELEMLKTKKMPVKIRFKLFSLIRKLFD